MADIATLSLHVDSSGLVVGKQRLDALAVAGANTERQVRRMESSLEGVSRETESLNATTASVERGARQMGHELSVAAGNTEQLGLAARQVENSLESVSRETRTLGASTAAVGAGARRMGDDLNVAASRAKALGAGLSVTERQAKSMGAGMALAGAQARTLGASARVGASGINNLTAQFNDIGLMLAAGQNPLTLALQQGTQVNQVFDRMRASGGSAKQAIMAIAAGLRQMASPMSIAVIGAIALSAALVSWVRNMINANREVRSMSDYLDDLGSAMADHRSAVREAELDMEKLTEKYGRFAERAREAALAQQQFTRELAQAEMDKFASVLLGEQGGMQRFFSGGGLSGLQGLFDGLSRIRMEANEQGFIRPVEDTRLASLHALVQEYERLTGQTEQQAILVQDKILPLTRELSLVSGDINEEEQKRLSMLNKFVSVQLEILGMDERRAAASQGVVKGAEEAAKAEERAAHWARAKSTQMLAAAKEQRVIAQYGKDSAEYMAHQAEAARETLEAQMEQRGVAADTRNVMRATLEYYQEQRQAAEGRLAADKETQRINALDQSRMDRERSLRDQTELYRLILKYGHDSVEVRKKERDVAREITKIELQRAGHSKDTVEALMKQYDAMQDMEERVRASSAALEDVSVVVDDIATAWGEWVVRGFSDFKSFADSVLNTFKRMLVEMIATAARNRIMISLGFGGGLGGLPGAALASGGGGGLGGLGIVGNVASTLFGGGGPLGSIGSALGLGGLFGGPTATAAGILGIGGGTAAGTAAIGAATTGLYGTGLMGGLSASLSSGLGLTAIGGNAALAGGGFLATLGAAIPVVAAVTFIIGAFTTKTKLLDEGLQVLVKDMDVTVNQFQRIKKSSFFGLVSSRRTNTQPLSEEDTRPFQQAVDVMAQDVFRASGILGLGDDVLEGFSHTLQISLRGLEGEARREKIQEAMKELQDKMAVHVLKPLVEGATEAVKNALNQIIDEDTEGITGAGERLNKLAASLVNINTILRSVGGTELEGLSGAVNAQDMVNRFSSEEDFLKIVGEFQQRFIPAVELMAQARDAMTATFEQLGLQMPESLDAYRELIASQDLTQESARALVAQLLQLAPGFFEVQAGVEMLMATMRAASAINATAISAGQAGAQGIIAAGVKAEDMESYYKSFHSEAEREAKAREDLDAVFREMGVNAPKDKAAFRKLVENQDLTTKEGQKRFAALVSASKTFSALEAAEAARAEAAARAAAAEAARRQAEAARQAAEAARRKAEAEAHARAMDNFRSRFYDDVELMHHLRKSLVDANVPTSVDDFREQVDKAAGNEQRRLLKFQDTLLKLVDLEERRAEGWKRFQESIRYLNVTLDLGSKNAREYADELTAMFDGGIEDFSRQAGEYYQNFFSTRERLRRLESEVADVFESLGVMVPRSRRDFRELVEAQDLTSESGRAMFAELIKISGEFAEITDEARRLNDELGDTQNLFRSLREETFVRSALHLDDAPSVDAIGNETLLHQLLQAVENGNINTARILTDLLLETERSSLQPTQQTVQ